MELRNKIFATLRLLILVLHSSDAFTPTRTNTNIQRRTSFIRSSKSIPNKSYHSTSLCSTPEDQLISTKTMDKNIINDDKSVIKNFRKAYGLHRIYRCASTDPLGCVYNCNNVKLDNSRNSPESILWNRAGLILDLRSDSERNETLAQSWMNSVPGGMFTKYFVRQEGKLSSALAEENGNYDLADTSKRFVYRIDLLSTTRLYEYLSQNWLKTPAEKVQYTLNGLFNSEQLHLQRIQKLNEVGLAGIYQSMLETSGEELFNALKSITTYLEQHQEEDDQDCMIVAVHCVHGKDRTGLVIMLCQMILEIDEEFIIEDYHKSDQKYSVKKQKVEKGKLNRDFFSRAPKEAMKSTIEFIKENHNGNPLNYLDSIGFDSTWRSRFVYVMNSSRNSPEQPRLLSKL